MRPAKEELVYGSPGDLPVRREREREREIERERERKRERDR